MTDDNFLKEITDEPIVLPKEELLSRLTVLAREQLDTERNMEFLESELAKLKEKHNAIAKNYIPELMQEIGVKEIVLSNGKRVKIAPLFTGKITDLRAYDWLEQNGYGEIVKITIEVNTRMSDIEKVDKVRKILQDAGIEWNEEQGVHYQTLCKWIKDTINSGSYIDRELFNVYTGWKATIK